MKNCKSLNGVNEAKTLFVYHGNFSHNAVLNFATGRMFRHNTKAHNFSTLGEKLVRDGLGAPLSGLGGMLLIFNWRGCAKQGLRIF